MPPPQQPQTLQFQYVKLPDGSYGKFNADASDDTIRAAITKDFPDAYNSGSTPASQQDEGMLSGAGHELESVAGGAKSLLAPPQTTTERVLSAFGPGAVQLKRIGQGYVEGAGKGLHQAHDEFEQAQQERKENSPLSATADYIRSGVSALSALDPFTAGTTAHLTELQGQGRPSEAMGAGLVDAALLGAPEVLPRAGGALKRFATGDLDRTIPGADVTPRQRFQRARNVGVNLDAADATNSPFFSGVKRVGENSLAGGHLYDRLKAANTSALGDTTNQFLDEMFPGDRELEGSTIQGALKNDQARLHSGAENGFKTLTEQTKGIPVKGARAVGKAAADLYKPMADLASSYPSLAPTKTLSVLSDLSRIGKKPQAMPATFLDAPGSEFAVDRAEPAAAKPVTWSDLQRLRSATHDLTLNNPDLVKTEALAPLQQMTGVLDNAMTDSAGVLTPAQTGVFRRANADWREMKDTYDNPSSPFYHAVRTDNPSTLSAGVGPKTPENARTLLRRLSDEQGQPTKAVGAIRRGTVESALKPTAEGTPGFRTFAGNLQRIPADYRAELFTVPQNEALRDISGTSNTLAKDFNPSGSAKQGQKIAEAMAMVPTMGTPLLQYPVAKMMTSPTVTDWLMKPHARPNPFVAPVATGAALNASKRRREK